MSYAFPNPLITPVFTAPNGITYSWDAVDSKWVIKQYALPNTYITPVAADIDYVRQDGTSTMTGDLKFNGNRTVKSTDGNIKLNSFGVTELAQGGNTKLTVSTNSVTVDTNLVGNFDYQGINIWAAGTVSAGSAFQTGGPSTLNGDVTILCAPGQTVFGVITEDTAANSSASYYGACTSPYHIVTKSYLESVLPESLPSWAFRNSNTLGDNSTLDGLWSVQYVTSSVEGQVIIKAKNDTTNIANGTIVTTMPANARPKSMAVIPLTSRDGLTTAFAVFSNQDGIITIQNVQGVGSTRLEGMLAYPIHDA